MVQKGSLEALLYISFYDIENTFYILHRLRDIKQYVSISANLGERRYTHKCLYEIFIIFFVENLIERLNQDKIVNLCITQNLVQIYGIRVMS